MNKSYPKNYPKYQFSIFPNGSRDEQLVIRTDTFEELIEAKKDIDKIVEKKAAKLTPATPTQPDWCPIHSCQMTMKKNQKTGQTFFSHRLPDGSWCNGKAK